MSEGMLRERLIKGCAVHLIRGGTKTELSVTLRLAIKHEKRTRAAHWKSAEQVNNTTAI